MEALFVRQVGKLPLFKSSLSSTILLLFYQFEQLHWCSANLNCVLNGRLELLRDRDVYCHLVVRVRSYSVSLRIRAHWSLQEKLVSGRLRLICWDFLLLDGLGALLRRRSHFLSLIGACSFLFETRWCVVLIPLVMWVIQTIFHRPGRWVSSLVFKRWVSLGIGSSSGCWLQLFSSGPVWLMARNLILSRSTIVAVIDIENWGVLSNKLLLEHVIARV